MPAHPFLQWSDKWQVRFYSMHVDTLMALDTSAQQIAMRMSNTPHPDHGLHLFSSRTTGKSEVAEYSDSPLIYANLTTERHKTKMQGEDVIRVIVKTFWK